MKITAKTLTKMHEQGYMAYSEVANALGLNPSSIAKKVTSGKLTGTTLGSMHFVLVTSVLEHFSGGDVRRQAEVMTFLNKQIAENATAEKENAAAEKVG